MADLNSFERFEYLVRTLSRTKRKDYENYVVNAIYNRVGDTDLKPVSQQYVKRADEGHAFIDLYFPQLNIGVECDEDFHGNQEEADATREATLFEVLSAINKDDYKPLHVEPQSNRSFSQIEADINKTVKTIKKQLELKKKNLATFMSFWDEPDPVAYYANREAITVSDGIGFPTIVAATNALFNTGYAGVQRGGFIPKSFRPLFNEDYMVWFPKLAVGGRSVSAGWNNTLSSDGMTIIERDEQGKRPLKEGPEKRAKRVVFAQVKDPITRKSSYRFVGVFELQKGSTIRERTYKRIREEFSLTLFRK